MKIIETKKLLNTFAAFAALLMIAGSVSAQSMEHHPRTPTINTTGEATVAVQPDQARIELGVTTQAETSDAAVTQNAEKLNATLAAVRALQIAGAEIKTVSYTLQPTYRYPREGGEPELTGYTATNIVRITINDLTKVGTVIDAGTKAGANRVQSLQFTLQDDRAVKAQALREAAQQAREKSNALAGALGLEVVRILNVTESGPTMIPVRDMAYARAEMASTPIEPGTIEIKASVSLTVEVK
ncbi:MAG TPA: SIMPL domain-containing protein [Pyrinomonadaceae bacterium]|nr:SIMPL domain-containing protein [Pyrinomonadaceae bacterium]